MKSQIIIILLTIVSFCNTTWAVTIRFGEDTTITEMNWHEAWQTVPAPSNPNTLPPDIIESLSNGNTAHTLVRALFSCNNGNCVAQSGNSDAKIGAEFTVEGMEGQGALANITISYTINATSELNGGGTADVILSCFGITQLSRATCTTFGVIPPISCSQTVQETKTITFQSFLGAGGIYNFGLQQYSHADGGTAYASCDVTIHNIKIDYSSCAILKGMAVEKDSQGNILNPLSGATIQISGGPTSVTNSLGEFDFEILTPGSYSVTASKPEYYAETQQITLNAGDTINKVFYLTPKISTSPPVSYNFQSSQGNYVIDNMPGNLNYSTMVAWNGTPGTIQFLVNGQWFNATTTTNFNDGTAKAELSISAPAYIAICHELTIRIINGEGKETYINAGIHYIPFVGVIPWYKDNIDWTPSGASLYHSNTIEYNKTLSLPNNTIALSCYFNYGEEIKYDLLAATLKGNLKGGGGLEFKNPSALPHVKEVGSGGIELAGEVAISLAGCNSPQVTPSWSLSLKGTTGFEAPIVLGLDIFVPGLGSSLANVPLLNDKKVKFFMKLDGKISGKYENSNTGNCILGSTGVSGTLLGGPEVGVFVDNKATSSKIGLFFGGSGSFEFGICPDLSIKSYTGRIYRRFVSTQSGQSKWDEKGIEIKWDFSSTKSAQVTAMPELAKTSSGARWHPIGQTPLKWGKMNRLSTGCTKQKPLLKSALSTASSEEETLLVENVIELANPSVFADASESLILYAHHDPSKPWYAATDIGEVYQKGTTPWEMDLLTDNLAAEYDPVITPIDEDTLLAAWTMVSGDVSNAETPDDIAPHLEIVSSWYNRAAGTWSDPVQLTTNSVVDRNPLPVKFGDNTGIVWIENQGGAMPGGAVNGDTLMYQEWSGSSWGVPQALWSGQKGILTFSFAADEQGHVIFSVDEDGDTSTSDDRELYEIQTQNSLWQQAVRLTNDSVEDSLPKLVTPNNRPMLVWKSGETLKYTYLDTFSPTDVYIKDTLANEAPTLDGTTLPGGAAIAYSVQSPSGVDIVAAFYDAALDKWSLPRQLTNDEDMESSLSMSFDGSELVIAYLKTQLIRQNVSVEINGQTQVIENVPLPGETNLYVLRHSLKNDLAVNSESFSVLPENPAPGTTATVKATVQNNGDLPVENLSVAFYDGDPNSGGSIISTSIITGPMIAGDSEDASISWAVPTDIKPHDLFVVVDPTLSFDDRDLSNNAASKQVCLPDMTVQNASNDIVSSTTVAVTATVSNTGVTPSGSFNVSWRLNNAGGQQIGSTTVDTVIPAASKDVTFLWTVGAPVQPDQFVSVCVVLDPENIVPEFDKSNNTAIQSVMIPMYTNQVGSLTVNIVPPEAVAAGVKWSIDGGVTWYASGATATLLSGTYSIIFSEAGGWSFPAIQNVVVQTGQPGVIYGGRILLGDVNADGKLDLADVITIFQIVSEIQPSGTINLGVDVNGDGKIGMAEAIYIMQVVAGLRTP